MPVWGLVLIFSAIIVAISSFSILPGILTPERLWGVVLFAAGAYLLISYFRSLKTEETPSFPAPPRSVVSAMLPGDVEGITTNYADGRTTSHLHER
jgi:hypothetical protein